MFNSPWGKKYFFDLIYLETMTIYVVDAPFDKLRFIVIGNNEPWPFYDQSRFTRIKNWEPVFGR